MSYLEPFAKTSWTPKKLQPKLKSVRDKVNENLSAQSGCGCKHVKHTLENLGAENEPNRLLDIILM